MSNPGSDAPATAQITLTIDGPNDRITRTLGPETVTIGRKSDNLIVLSDAEVSRYHAKIEQQASGWVITDLGSKNGTWMNGTRLAQQQPEPFGESDRIEIGPFALRVAPPFVPKSDGQLESKSTSSNPIPPAPEAPPATIISTPLPAGQMPLSFPPAPPIKAPEKRAALIDLGKRTALRLGRSPDNDQVLDHPQVSRHHALIERVERNFRITDLNSTNGTFVNGQRITEPTLLKQGDTVQIASYRYVLRGDQLEHYDDHGNISVQALHLNKMVGKGLKILSDVSLVTLPHEFVAIVGGSGAGKTTLLDALNGFRPATSGTVLYNGADLYRNFDAYRNVIGYVPQDDIIHRELSVYGALNYAAELRLPRDTSAEERNQRINKVMDDLGLQVRRDTTISSLSGGQRKRVSIGVELLNKPSLLFLDEPTSGLDPSTETKMMRLMRELADQGHAVLLVTHVTGNVSLCDKVVIMGQGGRLTFYGPPKDALAFFKVRDFVDIYDQLDKTPIEEWQAQYLLSPQYQNYVAQPLSALKGTEAETSSGGRVKPGFKRISALRQFIILSRRNLEILLRDRASLVLMLLIAPFLGLIDWATWKGNMFEAQAGNPTQAVTALFVAALNCVLVGSLVMMREIVKETEVYRRERMVGLGILPYLLSKVWIAAVLALYEALMFVLFKVLVIPSLPHDPVSLVQIYITLALATLGGMLMGLFVSAVSPNQNVAPLLTILFLVPQIIYGGGILPVRNLPNGELIGKATISKWGFDALVTISQIGTDVANDSCWQLSSAHADAGFTPPQGVDDTEVLRRWQDTLTEDYKKNQCKCLGPDIFSACKFPGITANYTAEDKQAVESAQPPEPTKPGDPPAQPSSPPAAPVGPGDQPTCDQTKIECQAQLKDWQNKTKQWQSDMTAWSKQVDAWKTKMDAWKSQMDAYKQASNSYQDKMNVWQNLYKDWNQKRETAIGSAEALVRKIFNDYGQFFKVDLVQDWGGLGAVIAAFFVLIFAAQKYKDIAGR